MSTYKINNKNFPWPEEGDSHWGGKVTDFIFALTNTVNNLLSKAILNNKDQTITGKKVFATLPKVLVQADENAPRTPHALVYSTEPINVDSLLEDVQANIDQLRQVLGANADNTILPEDLAETLLSLTPTRVHSIKNYLTGLIFFCNQLTPLGSIKAIYYPRLEVSSLAKWIPCEQHDPGATFLLQELIDQYNLNTEQQLIIDGTIQGFYKLTGGNWALCDGKFLLPLLFGFTSVRSFGSIVYQHVKNIPNLLEDVFLKGGNASDPAVTGTNSLALTSAQLPTHSHDLDITATSAQSPTHTHQYTRRSYTLVRTGTAVTSGSTHLGTALRTTTTNLNTQPQGAHSHSVPISGATAETGQGSPVDKTPKHLPVKYYMRVQ